jgi:putative oxidoreductase
MSIAAPSRATARRGLAGIVAGAVAILARIPESLVLLLARLAVAHAFWVSGQTKVSGPVVPLNLGFADLSFTLPTGIKPATYYLFATEYAGVPLPPALGAVLSSVAETLLPIALVLGLATRFAALGLLVMTLVIQVFVFPDAWWTVHVYWTTLLVLLMARGAGAISIDRLIARRYGNRG